MEHYLLGVPVTGPEVRARMVKGAKGLPFYLDLQVDTYEQLKNRGLTPEPAQFGGSEPEILGCFLDHLGQEAARMLTVLAHCRRFDEALWLDLGQAFRNGLLPFAFNDLQSFSFVEALDDGWSSLHALMREGLCGRTARNEPVLHVEIHRRLFAWWDERCRLVDLRSIASSHELALEEAAFHRAVFERGTFGDWARERGVPFARAGRFGVARDLWEAALAVEKAALPEHDSRIARTLNNLGNVLESLGDLDGAFALQTQALEIRRRAPCPDHQGIAGTLNALANVVPPHGRVPTSVSVP